ncbi:GntR family transcriptional regulator [Bacillus sp. H-16]|uniref:GntR family transcriptional regulator n=1 Tax=Alteribacter salitolerans TaxID=2912333 RepID=UPI001964D53A|nr:GntR family transcriptional regulator [Alteribacter salitolerans]MBM7095175.1 GntR family transcriptional regulator [Alteribacter salitolerans]
MEKISTLSIRENAFKQIRKEILNQQLRPGEKLSEAELADRLGISRTPVREALHKLELEGLVEIQPRKHCLVIGITPECLSEINLIRSELEPLASSHAVDHLTEEDLKYLDMLLQKSIHYHSEGDLPNLMKVHDEFHQLIIKASKLKRVVKILENMHDYIVSFRFSFLSRRELVERSIQEHAEILKALESKDKRKVESLVRNHLKGISEYESVVLEDTFGKLSKGGEWQADSLSSKIGK